MSSAFWLHAFALKNEYFSVTLRPVLAGSEHAYAYALKAIWKAGRRGGDSIAREDKNVIVVNLKIIGWLDG